MKITNKDTLKQALANIRLESLSLSQETQKLLKRALIDHSIDTTYIINTLRSKSSDVEKNNEK